jgi:hypothetical protein
MRQSAIADESRSMELYQDRPSGLTSISASGQRCRIGNAG